MNSAVPIHQSSNAESNFKLGGKHHSYLPALDGLRAIAIALVIIHHSAGGDFLAKGGFVGVDIFFVLSGFLITSILIKEQNQNGRISLSLFYARRALRLFPALFILFIAYVVYINLSGLSGEIKWLKYQAVLSALFYYNNWRMAFGGIDNLNQALIPTWSLSIEEQFYLVWPLALIGLLKLKSNKARISLIVAGIVIISLWQAIVWQDPAHAFRPFSGFDTRADGLLWGCLLGLYISQTGSQLFQLHRHAITVLALYPVVFIAIVNFTAEWNAGYMYRGGFTLTCIASVFLLLEAYLKPAKLFSFALENKLSIFIGRISYGLYIYHLPIFIWIGTYKRHWIISFALQIPLTLLVAILSYNLIEKPFLKLKKRYEPTTI